MTESVDAFYSVFNNMIAAQVDRMLPSILYERNNEAPEWFTMEMNNIKSEFGSRFSNLETQMNTKFAEVDSRFIAMEYRYSCLYNCIRRSCGYSAVSVPFLNRDEDLEELPSILSVEEIDRLSKQECQIYLRSYNVLFHPNETVKLKERLRDAIGLIVSHDRDYHFANFSN